MSTVDININEAVVTAIHEFNTFKGFGADFFIRAQSSNCTVYLQVAAYDNEARSYCNYIREGDSVRVTGTLKVKSYTKSDGTSGCSLLIERPIVFSKVAGGNCNPQLQQHDADNENDFEADLFLTRTNAVTASAITADAIPAASNMSYDTSSDDEEEALY